MVEWNPDQPVVLDALGYWSRVGIPASGLELIQHVRRGFDYRVLARLAESSGFSIRTLAAALGVSAYAIRQARRSGRWSSTQSDRLFRAARVLSAAQVLFGGDCTLAHRWLTTSQRGLNEEPPLAWLMTDVEAQAVLDLIGRIDNGLVT